MQRFAGGAQPPTGSDPRPPTMTNPQKSKGDCKCCCGGAPSLRGAEYVRGHRPPPSLADVFWPKVDKSGECWIWTGYIRPAGYGMVGLPGQRKTIDAHRASWMLAYGSIPVGAFVCHHCDNPPCVRPDHLFIGTALMNSRDAVAKGRIASTRARGMASGNGRLTDEQIAEIRCRHIAGIHPARKTGGSSTELAREFGITKQYVWQLVADKWRVP